MEKTGTPNEYRRELKKKIVTHAMHEFQTQGIRAVKMDDMAKSLGISKRTVYEIYKDKEELLIDVICTRFMMAHEKMKRVSESSANVIVLLAEFYKMHMEDTAAICPAFFADVEKYPKAVAFIDEKSKDRDKQALGFFQRGVDEGYFQENIDYDVIMQIAKNTSQSIMQNQLFKEYPMQKLLRNMLILYLRGVCTVKGVDLLDKLISEEDK